MPDADAQELAQIDSQLGELRRHTTSAEELIAQANTQAAGADARLSALNEQQERVQDELTTLTKRRLEQLTELTSWAREFATLRTRVVDLTPNVNQNSRALQAARERLERASLAVVRTAVERS